VIFFRLSVCLLVFCQRITQKVTDGFRRNFERILDLAQLKDG